MTLILLAANGITDKSDFGKVPPIGMLIVLGLIILFVFLFKLMDKQLKKTNQLSDNDSKITNNEKNSG